MKNEYLVRNKKYQLSNIDRAMNYGYKERQYKETFE